MARAVVAFVDDAPLPDAAYQPVLTAADRRLAVAEGRMPAQGWRAELDVTTEAVEGRVMGRLGRRGATLAGYARHGWDGENEAGLRVSVPL